MFYLANYAALRVLLVTLSLIPARSGKDLAFRSELAVAISSATDDVREQDVLARIAWLEGAFRSDVADCSVRGDRGRSLGLFQAQPQSDGQRRAACGSLFEQASLAVANVRRSAEACPGNVGADRLAMYVSGTCSRGLPQARHRWGADDVVIAESGR